MMLASTAKASPPDPFFHAARHNGLEQLAQKIALAKTAVAVLGERRMIGDVAVEPQATEPAIGKVEVDLVAQPPFGANAEAVADNEHPDHQLRIDRRATRLAVVRLQMRSNLRKVDEPVDPAKQVIVGDMPLKAEAVEQRLLHHPPFAHHRPNLPRPRRRNQRTAPKSSGVFQRNRREAAIPVATFVERPGEPTVGRHASSASTSTSRADARLTKSQIRVALRLLKPLTIASTLSSSNAG